MEFVEFENLKVGDLLKQTISDTWAIWEINKTYSGRISCDLKADKGSGWSHVLDLSKEIYYSVTPSKFKYIGKIDDFPELLL